MIAPEFLQQQPKVKTVPIALVMLATMACLMPAVRAARLDPLRVLRSGQ